MRRTAVPVGRALVALTLVSLLAACAPPGQGDGAQGPRLVSNTATLNVFEWDREGGSA